MRRRRIIINRRSFCVVVLLSALIFTAATQVAQAADYNRVGVRAGNTADYSVTGPALVGPAGTAKMHIEVIDVNGTTVTVEMTFYDSSGMVIGTPQMGTGDISTTMGAAQLHAFLICAGLTVGDDIFRDSSGAKITSSADKTIAGAIRTVNIYTYYTGTYVYGWDKETGMLVEISITTTSDSVHIEMTATNMWSSFLIILIIVIIVAVVAVVVVLVVVLKLRKPKPTPVAVQSRGT